MYLICTKMKNYTDKYFLGYFKILHLNDKHLQNYTTFYNNITFNKHIFFYTSILKNSNHLQTR